MKKTTRIICITLCVLLIALSAAGVIWALYSKFAKNQAYAEYTDLAGTNTLVNFNQQLQVPVFTANTTSSLTHIVGNTISFVIGHTYYFKSNTTNNQFSNNIDYGFGITPIYTYTNTTSNNSFLLYANTISGQTYTFMLIDLTQMFGAGNEPNLQQAQDYFTAAYYSYNTGTAIPYSKDYLQGYQDGANDLYESMTITYNAYTIGSTSATYANNTIERGTFAFDNQYGAYTFSGVISVNLTANVERGTNFDIDFDLFIPDLQGETAAYALTFKLYFAYVDENNVLQNITTITPTYKGSQTNNYVGSFILPITTSTIYLYLDYNTIGDNFSPTQAIVFKSDMTFKTTDMGLLMNNSYQRGYNAAAATYYYGTDNYNAIYNLGFQNGLAQQNATLGAMEYIGAAFTGIGSILQIELLPGVPFSLFILLPLMFGLIAFVVKLSKGGD